MITTSDIVNHWPYVAEQLLLSREPAADRVLWTLAELQAANEGGPVAVSRSRLQGLGQTAGEAGRAWRRLVDLEGAKVVTRYRGGGGRRPDLWTFTLDMRHWRMPWRRSGFTVAHAIEFCSCSSRARFALPARFPGLSLVQPREDAEFRLPPGAHLDFYTDFRAAGRKPRAANDPVSWENSIQPRGYEPTNGALSTASFEPKGSLIDPTIEKARIQDEARTVDRHTRLCRSVAEASGVPTVFGAPARMLRQAAELVEDIEPLLGAIQRAGRLPDVSAAATWVLAQAQGDFAPGRSGPDLSLIRRRIEVLTAQLEGCTDEELRQERLAELAACENELERLEA
jgi:hypothetical protein